MSNLESSGKYVSAGGDKLASVAKIFGLDFKDKIILDVGSSTGGFTDFALQHGAKKVVAVEKGTRQLHPRLLGHDQIKLYEKTDILNFHNKGKASDIILIDVSFISVRSILPYISALMSSQTQLVAMAKPQFEAPDDMLNRGVVKNEKMRRAILADLELFMKKYFVVIAKSDSGLKGEKGNLERFYLLKKLN